MTLPAHFYMAPSSAAQWIHCPGSLRACASLPPEEEDKDGPAYRGTIGHVMSEADLKGEMMPEVAINYLEGLDPKARDELVKHVEVAVDLVADSDADVILYETKIQSNFIEEHGGTVDVMEYWKGSRTLQVTDFKFGRVKVEIEDNKQVKCYLNLARQLFPKAQRFIGRVIQPVWSFDAITTVFSAEELDDHEADVINASISDYFKAGDHCFYCDYGPQCKTLARHLAKQVDEFPDLTQAVGEGKDDIETLANIYKAYKMAEKMLKGCGTILKEKGKKGGDLEAFGLGLQVTHRMYWKDLAEDALMAQGIPTHDYIKPNTLVTPSQLKENLTAQGWTEEEFESRMRDAIEWKPITSLVFGKDSNPLPEFD